MGSRKQIGKNIEKARGQAGLTQDQLAVKTGISLYRIKRIENGEVRLPLNAFEVIVKALKIHSVDILPF